MNHWRQQRERGGLFWLSALSWCAQVFGRGFLRVLCAPIAAFFLLTAAQPRRASREYLRRVLPHPPTLRDIFRHFYTFALVSADRLLLLGGKSGSLDLRMSGEDCVRDVAARGEGCLLLVSHVGSFDAMRLPAVEDEAIPVRILLDRAHNPHAMAVIEKLNPQLAADTIDAGMDATQLVLVIREALDRGELVGIMGDRAAAGEALFHTDLLGSAAGFPRAPWLMALVLRTPVILCWAIYTGGNRYNVTFKRVYDGSPAHRRERQDVVQACIRSYAAEMESVLRSNPYNWFNFYDFWLDESSRDN